MRDRIASDEEDYSDGEENNDVSSRTAENTTQANITGEIDVDYNIDEMSETTETDVISALVEQSEYYENVSSEVVKKDTEKTLQSYIKKIYKQVKFLTESGKNYKEPNFVQYIHGQKSQSVELCEYLWKSLGEYSKKNINICIVCICVFD